MHHQRRFHFQDLLGIQGASVEANGRVDLATLRRASQCDATTVAKSDRTDFAVAVAPAGDIGNAGDDVGINRGAVGRSE